MRDSPAAALAFLIALILIPTVIGYGIVWGVLRYTNSGLLVYWEELATPTVSANADRSEKGTQLACSYFTGTRILRQKIASRKSADDEVEPNDEGGCPWRIEVS